MRPLPRELCRQVEGLLQRRYRSQLQPGERFTASGEVTPEQVEVRLRLDAIDGADRTEVTARVPLERGHDVEASLTLGLDAADALLGQWLESERTERFPIDFEEARFEGRTLLVRLVRSRPSVEAEADRLLAEAGEPPEPGDT